MQTSDFAHLNTTRRADYPGRERFAFDHLLYDVNTTYVPVKPARIVKAAADARTKPFDADRKPVTDPAAAELLRIHEARNANVVEFYRSRPNQR